MRFQIASDLHLSRDDVEKFRLPDVPADALLIAGDVSNVPQVSYDWARANLSSIPTLAVTGNHEYCFSEAGFNARLNELQKLFYGTCVQIVEKSTCYFGPVRFLSTTLWTDFQFGNNCEVWKKNVPPSARSFFDFREIALGEADADLPTTSKGRFTPITAMELHRRNVEWLRNELDRTHPGPTVVMTHHAPSHQSLPGNFKHRDLIPAFASNLEDLIGEYQPEIWIHGHIHSSCDYQLGKTRVICNPRGYPREYGQHGFNPELTFDI